MACFVRECIDIGKDVVLVVHQNVRRRRIAAARKRTTAFCFCLVTIHPPPAQAFGQNVDIFGTEGREGCDHFFGRFIEANASVDFQDKRNIGVVGVKFIEIEDTTSQFIVTDEWRNAFTHRTNQSIIDRDRDVVRE